MIDVKLTQVIDNNCIDREVTQYKPTHAIIEALWVVPEKFDILQRLHPNVTWVIRIHSDISFIANEGVSMDWICRYSHHKNVVIACNADDAVRDVRTIVSSMHPDWTKDEVNAKVIYLPNYYPIPKKIEKHKRDKDKVFVDVACFGAVRPMKNHLQQAVAAIRYAEKKNKILRFHINGNRNEQGGDNNLKNLRNLFKHVPHELVEHPWMDHDKFIELLRTMDVGLQVSFSETFNIVAADYVVSGLPIVVSPEIDWVDSRCQAEPTNSEDIFLTMLKVTSWWHRWILTRNNLKGLRQFCKKSRKQWLRYLQA